MTTLLLETQRVAREGGLFAHPVSLRAWLAGDWGLLFSHPDDFAYYDIEADRWLSLLQEAFTAASLRPLGLARHPDATLHGWIAEVNGGARSVALTDRGYWPHIADFRTHALRESVHRSRSRFVMILDADLRLRRTMFYAAGSQLPSLFDLIALAQKARTLATPNRARVTEATHALVKRFAVNY
jgi:alkyl hydroperoxide reductase subunit AhpC